MKKHLQHIAARAALGLRLLGTVAAGLRPDAMMACGAAGIAYGAWQMYQPAGFIVGGGLLLIAGVLAARKAA
jgi:hypothetical protein